MAVYTHVPAEAVAALLADYGLGALRSVKGIAEGVENSNYLVDAEHGRFILTLYEKRVDAADLPFFIALLDHLADRGLPVPRALRDTGGAQVRTLCGRPACLIEFLDGVSLSHPTPRQAMAAGRAMAEMHRAVEDFGLSRENTMGVDHWLPLFERCGRDLDTISPGLYDDLGFLLDDTRSAWREHDAMPRGVIHADLFPDNVLMRGDAVGGLIDFYFACTDFRAYDLAIAHSAWAFDASGNRFDRAIGEALVAGYQQVIQLEPVERVELGNLAQGACIRFLLSRAWDWLNTPADALVTRKDPMAYWRRLKTYDERRTNIG